ncbi:MAG: FecR domain-containing protein [Myxococcota bacterium]|nr:FecR domain-containing protein [Myxococcota bacterium]
MTPQDRAPTPDELVARLVNVARDASEDALGAREQAGFHRLERTLVGTAPKQHRAGPWLRLALLPVALAATVGAYLVHERAITFEVVSARVADGGYVSSTSVGAAVRFSDDSDLRLEPGTRMRISRLEVRGAHVMLEGGKLHVRIHPQPRGSWTLDAGPYIVHVTGTEFDLAWRVDEQTLDLQLRKGSVTVEGPLALGGVKVDAGQRLIANANAGTLSLVDEVSARPPAVENPQPPAAPPLPPPATASPQRVASVAPVASTPRSVVSTANARADEPTWVVRVAHGDFEAVIEAAQARGLDRVLAESSAVDLAALADAARYAQRPDVAQRALTAERLRYPGSVQARDAAFFLGGLAEGQKNETSSLEWYGVYLGESANGAYASQALGRKMMLVQRQRGTEGARPIATEYLARFPNGAYGPSARKLLQAQ